MINEERRPLTMGIFKYAGINPDQKYISFDEYLICVCTFATLTKPELYEYCFDLYDKDNSGSLDESEFEQMSKELQSKQFHFPQNLRTAIKMIGGKAETSNQQETMLVDLQDFIKFAKKFPVTFYPITNFQKNIREQTLGEHFWSESVGRKMKIQTLVSYMRRNYGAVPPMTCNEKFWSLLSDEIFLIRKRAAEIYTEEVAQRRRMGSTSDGPPATITEEADGQT